jgi:magnesium transporter
VLHVVSTILTDDTAELKEQCDEFMRQVLEFNIKDDPLTVLRIVKDAVLLMTNRVKAFNQSLNRLLSDDEDMALMNLSRLLTHPERFIQPVPQTVLDEESDEPELIIESNLQIGLSLLNVLQLLQGQVTSAKELVDQKQDATRNKLLFANMLLSVFSLCTTLAAMVGSFFGMNVRLPVGDENPTNDPAAYRPFNSIVYGTVGAAVTLCCFIMAVLWFTGTIPRTVKVRKTKFS